MATSLGRIFNSAIANKIEVLYDEVSASGVLDQVGTTAMPPLQLAVSAQKPDLKVFDLSAEVGADAKASAVINAATTTIAPFDPADAVAPDAGKSWAQLHVEGKLSGEAGGTLNGVPLSISASGAATFAYDHYVQAAAGEERLAALARLVSSAQLPQLTSPAALQPGEVSRFEAALNLDLGLKATFGGQFNIDETIGLFAGLSGQFQASVRYSIEAALGWSLFDDMQFTVGRAQTITDGWVRIRMERSRKNTFTAGATFALAADYDASSLATALEKAFDMSPLPRAIDILTQVGSLSWDDVKAKVTDRAATELIALIAGTGWKEEAANSKTVTDLFGAINKVITTYNSIEPKARQLWSSLLVRVGAQPGSDLRKTIDAIAALNPQQPDLRQFLSPTAQNDLDMLEALTGRSVEQLLVGSNTSIEIAISRAVSLAKQLQRVLTDTPTQVTNALQQFAETSGVKSAIAWLAQNATSLDAIQQSGDQAIRNLVAKAVGKALGDTTPADVQAVQTWAKKLIAQWDALSAKLTNAAKFLKGSVGFSVALEYSRVSEFSAVLDFELDPSNAAVVKAVRTELPAGSISDMLVALENIRRDDDTAALPFTIRESVLVSRQTRTGATSVLLSLAGLQKLQKVTGARTVESTVHVSNTGRQATFSGGFLQAVNAGRATNECGVWISIDATAPTIDEKQPYAKAERSMRLTFARNDSQSDAAELQALQTLLMDLGFFQTGAANVTAPAGAETSFTLDISLPEEAVNVFVTGDGEANWNNDYRNAAYRLLKDDMVTDSLPAVNQPLGEVLAAVVADQRFGSSWTDTSLQQFIRQADDPGFGLRIGRGEKRLRILNDRNLVIPPYTPLQMLIVRRPRGMDELARLRAALVNNGMMQSDFQNVASLAAALFADTSFPNWDNPMFNFWFVVARLTRLAKTTNVLKNASGLATFRFRTAATATLSAPVQWTLTPEVGVSVAAIAGRQLFPFA